MKDEDLTALREAQRILFDAERERLAVWDQVREQVFTAMTNRQTEFTLTLPTLQWLDIIDEIQDRHARNMSRLVRDDLIEQLQLAIDRMHEEIKYMIVFGPAPTVSQRIEPSAWPTEADVQ